MDIQAYFRRIGYTGTAEPTLSNLAAILRCHLETVPFENLDCWPKGKALTNDPAVLYEKVVLRRRGGVCFELNGLFYELLKAIGYDCYPVSVRTHMRPGPTPITHEGIVAVVDGKKYYCDVGFGGPGPKGLVAMDTEDVQEIYGQCFRVTREAHTVSILWFREDVWAPILSFADIANIPEDFSARLYYFSTAPESYFVVQRLANLCLPCGGSKALTNNHLTIRRNGSVSQRDLQSEEEVTDVLREEFGLVL